MFKRLSNGLLSPKEITKYAKDSFWKTTLYLLILVILMLIPTFISSVQDVTLSTDFRVQIMNSFSGDKIPFKIVDGVMKNTSEEVDLVYTNTKIEGLSISITEDRKNYSPSSLTSYSIVLANDGVYVYISTIGTKFFTFNDYELLKNIDLSAAESNQNIEFWNIIFNSTERVINSYKPVNVVIYMVSGFFEWLIWLLVIAVIMATFAKFRSMNLVTFKEAIKFGIYNLTPFVFCMIFSVLFNFTLLFYLGYLLSAIYNVITVNEIIKERLTIRKRGNEDEL